MKFLFTLLAGLVLLHVVAGLDSINVGQQQRQLGQLAPQAQVHGKGQEQLQSQTQQQAHFDIKGESTKQVPLKLELWGLYCSNMGNMEPVETHLPHGFTCENGGVSAQQKTAMQNLITQTMAKEKSPAEASQWQAQAEQLYHQSASPSASNIPNSLVELRAQITAATPVHAAARWPRRTIPYCWDMGWHLWTRILSWIGMRRIIANTNIRFERVECNAAGHKVAWTYVANAASSCPGVFQTTAATHCAALPAPVVPANTAPMPKPAPASTKQELRYDSARGNSFTAAHEMLHNLGVHHTQARQDRAGYVKITANKASANCAKTAAPWADSPAGYNYESIMHYPAGGFCGIVAIKPKAAAHGDPAHMGNRARWVAADTTTVNTLYAGVPL